MIKLKTNVMKYKDPSDGNMKNVDVLVINGNNVEGGSDGYSPIAKVEQTEDGATISITDKNGTTTATVKDGKDGKSAYQHAVDGGYEGTEEEFSQMLANGANGLTQAQITALDNMFKKCAFTEDVSTEYEAFKIAFGLTDSGEIEPDEPIEPDTPVEPDVPEVTLSSISATYTGGNVVVGTSVNSLSGITVKAIYSDGSTKNVTGYTLSGTITEGNNTITVSYGGKTTTFTVTGVAESDGEETGVSNETTWTDGVAYTYNSIQNEYVDENNGSFIEYISYDRTPYLYCDGASKLRIVVVVNSGTTTKNGLYNAFYDAEKNFIKNFDFSGIDGDTIGVYKEIDIPENAVYFVASHKSSVISGFGTYPPYVNFVPYA